MPALWRECSVFPRMDGFSDLLSLYSRSDLAVAWTAAAAGETGYLWFSLKDTALLPATLMWIEERVRDARVEADRVFFYGNDASEVVVELNTEFVRSGVLEG